jgi:hypothetical protein
MGEYSKAQILEVLGSLGFSYAEQDLDHLKVIKVNPSATANIHRKVTIDNRRSLILIYAYDKLNRLRNPDEINKAIHFVCLANPHLEIGSLEVREDKGLMHYRVSQLLPGVSDIREVFKYMLKESEKVFTTARSALLELRNSEDVSGVVARFFP